MSEGSEVGVGCGWAYRYKPHEEIAAKNVRCQAYAYAMMLDPLGRSGGARDEPTKEAEDVLE